MDRETANVLIVDWRWEGPANDQPSTDASRRLTQLMLELVGQPELVSGVTLEDGSRAALVLHEGSLFITTATGEGSDVQVSVRREPLDSNRVLVTMNERKEGQPPVTWVRTWTFQRVGEEPFLSFLTHSHRRDEKEPRATAFARRLCRTVGWDIPVEEPR
ncbi:MAG TPA: hypothetical protein VHF88_07480 [Thermoleophilaceae bacterium]|nr:hypothetical protein [Thermoleophilaceae bacterium]